MARHFHPSASPGPEPRAAYAVPRQPKSLFWFRRDLRLADNAGLHHALKGSHRVWTAFVFDRDILDALPSRRDRRVQFIHEAAHALDARLAEAGGGLIVRDGAAREAVPRLAVELGVDAVFANTDYEPAAHARDAAVAEALGARGIAFHRYKDTVIFEKDELLTQAGTPYATFTPYRSAWLKACGDFEVRAYPIEPYAGRLARPPASTGVPSLEALGFRSTDLAERGSEAAAEARLTDFLTRIDRYHETRDRPALPGGAALSVHNRFGTISIRRLARAAREAASAGGDAWLSELVWRDFFFQVLHHHPRVVDAPWRSEFARLRWSQDDDRFAAWCEGRTGYPLVDAGMRQLVRTGTLHNRVRMVTASFLVKDLLIDWRRGERFFAEHLFDYDLAANNGNWQWVASTGCDAQPWFRIFNPVTQSQRFDPAGDYIRSQLPELARLPARALHAPWTLDAAAQRAAGCVVGRDYPAPIVDHATQRAAALALYREAAQG